MRHLPFIAAAYALGTIIPIAYALAAAGRARQVRLRLAAVETRVRAPVRE